MLHVSERPAQSRAIPGRRALQCVCLLTDIEDDVTNFIMPTGALTRSTTKGVRTVDTNVRLQKRQLMGCDVNPAPRS